MSSMHVHAVACANRLWHRSTTRPLNFRARRNSTCDYPNVTPKLVLGESLPFSSARDGSGVLTQKCACEITTNNDVMLRVRISLSTNLLIAILPVPLFSTRHPSPTSRFRAKSDKQASKRVECGSSVVRSVSGQCFRFRGSAILLVTTFSWPVCYTPL